MMDKNIINLCDGCKFNKNTGRLADKETCDPCIVWGQMMEALQSRMNGDDFWVDKFEEKYGLK
jgi:hypothetical protein